MNGQPSPASIRAKPSRRSALEVHHLPTGHWPMFSRPADLAALLAKIAS